MTPLDQYTRTGRVLLGPGSDLVEMRDPRGDVCTAICFHPEYRRHPAINAALGIIVGFLEQPMVPSLTELVACDLTDSVFVYPTGPTWSVAELARSLGDVGEAAGVRAGLELIAAAGSILVEAAEVGEGAGVYSHGGLTPWRILIDAKGGVQIIGHGLPQVEILAFHEDPNRIPREDAFRYCPPERMRARKENWSSDIFGLGLIACELMTGRPVYDGLVNDIRTKAARGETSRRIHQFRQHIPEAVRELLATMLSPDFGDRFQGGADFLDFVDHAAAEVPADGMTLHDVTRRVARHVKRVGAELDHAQTAMLTAAQVREMLGASGEGMPRVRAMDPLTSGDSPKEPPSPGSPAPRTEPQRPDGQRADPARVPGSVGRASGVRGRRGSADAEPVVAAVVAAPVVAAVVVAPVVAGPVVAAPVVPAPVVAAPVVAARGASAPVAPAPVASVAVELSRPEAAPPPMAGASPVTGAVPMRSGQPVTGGVALGERSSASAEPPVRASAPPQRASAPPVRAAAPLQREAPSGGRPAAGHMVMAGPVAVEAPVVAGSTGGGALARPTPSVAATRFDVGGAVSPGTAPVVAPPVGAPPPVVVQAPVVVAAPVAPRLVVAPVVVAAPASAPVVVAPVVVAAPVPSAPTVAPVSAVAPAPVVAKAPVTAPAPVVGKAPASGPIAAVPPVNASASGILNPVSSARWSPPKRTRPVGLGGETPSRAEPAALPGPDPATPPVTTPPVMATSAEAARPLPPSAAQARPASAPTASSAPASSAPPLPPMGAGAGTSESRAAEKLARLRGDVRAAEPVPDAVPTVSGLHPRAPTPPSPAAQASPPVVSSPAPPAPVNPPPSSTLAPVNPLASSTLAPFDAQGDAVPLLFARPGQAPARRRIAGRATLAQTAARLVGVLAPLRLGLDGRLAGWYRLGPDSGPLPGDMRVGEVPSDMALHLHFVENRPVAVAVEVRTPEPVRLQLPLGTAVPLSSVLDAVCRLLSLPPGDWAASLDGLPLDGAAILADCTLEADSLLVVARP